MKRKKHSLFSVMTAVVGGVAGVAAGMAGGWLLYSRFKINHNHSLPDAIKAQRKIFQSRTAGDLSYYVENTASGRPLVLVHSINAAANSYEMKPLFDFFTGKRPVYALDLPGFGFSERRPCVYVPRLYENAIREFLDREVGEPADVVTLSLSGEFAARVASFHPELFHSLCMISPTGFSAQYKTKEMPQKAVRTPGKFLVSILSFPLWSRGLFDLITTRISIRYFLSRVFTGEPDPGLVDYAYAVSHQPGAEHAPLFFLSGSLFTVNVQDRIYDRLGIPTLVIYDQDPFIDFESLDAFIQEHENWQAVRIAPSKGMPHFEKSEETIAALQDFWKKTEQAE